MPRATRARLAMPRTATAVAPAPAALPPLPELPKMPPTARGYATIIVDRHSSTERMILGLYAEPQSVRGTVREHWVWRPADTPLSGVHGPKPSPLVSAISVAHAVRTLRDAYARHALTLYPLRTPDERARAITAGVLTPTTGTLERAELEALGVIPPTATEVPT